jgi:hypothetical protein
MSGPGWAGVQLSHIRECKERSSIIVVERRQVSS